MIKPCQKCNSRQTATHTIKIKLQEKYALNLCRICAKIIRKDLFSSRYKKNPNDWNTISIHPMLTEKNFMLSSNTGLLIKQIKKTSLGWIIRELQTLNQYVAFGQITSIENKEAETIFKKCFADKITI